jgi:hypothetical protein
MKALYFTDPIDLPIEGGMQRKVHSRENRTITRLSNGDYQIVESYKDREAVVLDVPHHMAVGQPVIA